MSRGFTPYHVILSQDLPTSGDVMSEVIELGEYGAHVGVHIEHPSGPTTTYYFEASNSTKVDSDAGNAKFFPWNEGNTPAAINSAGTSGYDRRPPFNLFRVRASTASGGGAGKTAKVIISVRPR